MTSKNIEHPADAKKKLVVKQLVERLIDAKDRNHITEAQFVQKIKSGYKPGDKVTIMAEVEE